MPFIGKFYILATSVIVLAVLWWSVSSIGMLPGVVPALIIFPGKPTLRYLSALSFDLLLHGLNVTDDNAKLAIDGIYRLITPLTSFLLMIVMAMLIWGAHFPIFAIDALACGLTAHALVEHLVQRKIVPPEKLIVLVATWIAISVVWILARQMLLATAT